MVTKYLFIWNAHLTGYPVVYLASLSFEEAASEQELHKWVRFREDKEKGGLALLIGDWQEGPCAKSTENGKMQGIFRLVWQEDEVCADEGWEAEHENGHWNWSDLRGKKYNYSDTCSEFLSPDLAQRWLEERTGRMGRLLNGAGGWDKREHLRNPRRLRTQEKKPDWKGQARRMSFIYTKWLQCNSKMHNRVGDGVLGPWCDNDREWLGWFARALCHLHDTETYPRQHRRTLTCCCVQDSTFQNFSRVLQATKGMSHSLASWQNEWCRSP